MRKIRLSIAQASFGKAMSWYMIYVGNTRKVGYETFLARSSDLLHWAKLGRLGFQPGGWDCWQADGGAALCDPTWAARAH